MQQGIQAHQSLFCAFHIPKEPTQTGMAKIPYTHRTIHLLSG